MQEPEYPVDSKLLMRMEKAYKRVLLEDRSERMQKI